MWIGREMQTTGDPPWVHVFCLRWTHFVEMQETTNHCIVYDGSEDNRSTSFMIVHYLI